MVRRLSALTRQCGCGSLYVRELSAGAAFVPAGFSPGTGDCARGGTDGGTDGGTAGERRGDAELLPSRAVGLAVLSRRFALAHARHCGSVAALCLGARLALRSCRGAFPRFASGIAVLSRRFALARVWHCVPVAALPSRTVGFAVLLRCCPRFTPGFAVLSRRFALARVWHCVPVAALFLGSRLLFVLRQTGRLAISCVPIPPGRDRHSCVLAALFGYLTWRVHFGLVRFFMAIPTGDRGRGKRSYEGYGARGWRRGACASLRNRIGLAAFSAGSTLGLRAPDCAKESSTLWTLFTLRRGCVGADSLRRHPGTIGDLTGSNLWPGRSCGRTIAPTRSNVQTRAARRQRRGVGFQRAERSGSGTAASLDSLHAAAGLGWCVFAGTARRPA